VNVPAEVMAAAQKACIEAGLPEEIGALIGTPCNLALHPLLVPFIMPCANDHGYDLVRFAYSGDWCGSTHGEYQLLREIFDRLNIGVGVACEFGAWDGMTASNTFGFVKNGGWECVMMETDNNKFQDLLKTAENYPSIRPYRKTIHYLPGKGILLDEFFESIDPICNDLDLLSIDVDSCDYHIWKSLVKYSPKVVIIEANRLNLDVIQQEGIPHKGTLGGSTSYKPMIKLGEDKGYTLVATLHNLIFVRNNLVEKLILADPSLERSQ